MHGAKGLEADYIVLPGMSTGTSGYPSNIADDPVLYLAMAEEGTVGGSPAESGPAFPLLATVIALAVGAQPRQPPFAPYPRVAFTAPSTERVSMVWRLLRHQVNSREMIP